MVAEMLKPIISNNYVLQSLKTVFTLANSADPDEMHFVAFHLVLHCLLKYPFMFPVYKGFILA